VLQTLDVRSGHDLESMHPPLARELPRIRARIGTQLPAVDTAEIAAAVVRAVQRFDGARVTEFLPVLVERAALDDLRARGAA
jgi:hypothetical protein